MIIIINDKNPNSNISFIISTNGKNEQTKNSVPKDAELIISISYPLGRARNDGVSKSTKEWICICDDDITLTPIFLSYINQLKSKDVIIMMESYWPSPFGLGRFMFFHHSVFEKVGSFVEISHGDETEWIIRAIQIGYKLIRVPRESASHTPHTQVKPKSGDFLNLIWLISKHPFFMFYLIRIFVLKMRYSSDRDEYIR